MFGLSGEHLLILGIILLLFGSRKLPELGNSMGKAIKNFKDSMAGVQDADYRKIEEKTANNPTPTPPVEENKKA